MDTIRIDGIRKATYCGRKVKIFTVWIKQDGETDFVHAGQYSVPMRTPNRDLACYYADCSAGFHNGREPLMPGSRFAAKSEIFGGCVDDEE